MILEGQNTTSLVGAVLHPNGNIAEALVRDGLAKIVDWSIPLVTNGPTRLREAEKCGRGNSASKGPGALSDINAGGRGGTHVRGRD